MGARGPQPKKKPEVQLDAIVTMPEIDSFQVDGQEVTNAVAYEEFKVLAENYWIRDGRVVHTSDMNMDCDLLQTFTSFVNQCSHLPKDEYRVLNAKQYIAKCYYHKMIIKMRLSLGNPFKGLSYTNLVLEQRKAEVLELFGRMLTIEEVHRTATQDWGLQVTIKGLEEFRKENQNKITELNAAYVRDFSNIKLGYKRSRLDELSWLYFETKDQYLKTNNRDDKKFLKELLEAVKKEVEGDLIRIQGDIHMNIEQTLSQHITNEVLKKLPINELIITRVCARVGKNPLMLLHRLQHSYYSAFTGFKPDPEINIYDSTPEYPSAFVYDLDKLQSMHQSKEIENAQLQIVADNKISVSPERQQQALSLKEIIKQKLAEQKKGLHTAQIELANFGGEK